MLESDIALDAEAEVVDRRRIVIASNGEDARRADAERRRQQVFDRREVRRRRDHVRRRFDELQHLIVVETVKNADAAAQRSCRRRRRLGEPTRGPMLIPGESNTPSSTTRIPWKIVPASVERAPIWTAERSRPLAGSRATRRPALAPQTAGLAATSATREVRLEQWGLLRASYSA